MILAEIMTRILSKHAPSSLSPSHYILRVHNVLTGEILYFIRVHY